MTYVGSGSGDPREGGDPRDGGEPLAAALTSLTFSLSCLFRALTADMSPCLRLSASSSDNLGALDNSCERALYTCGEKIKCNSNSYTKL